MSEDSDTDAEFTRNHPATTEERDGFLDLEDTTLQRDDSGDIKPQEVYVDELGGKVLARSLDRNERRMYVEELLDEDEDREELADSELAELFEKKIVEPDLTDHPLCENGRVTERFVTEGLNSAQEDGFFLAILLASGERDLVRIMRGQYRDEEIKHAIARETGRMPTEAPGNGNENEIRRSRRKNSQS